MIVRIIGAGIAGLTAAQKLAEKNNCEIHVHEASNHIGGRLWSSDNNGIITRPSFAVIFSLQYINFITLLKSIKVTDTLKAYDFINTNVINHIVDYRLLNFSFMNIIYTLVDFMILICDILRFKFSIKYQKDTRRILFNSYIQKFYGLNVPLILKGILTLLVLIGNETSLYTLMSSILYLIKNKIMFLNGNLNDCIFNPLYKQLCDKGVIFHFNDPITYHNQTFSCQSADAFIIAVDLNNAKRLFGNDMIFPKGIDTKYRVTNLIACKSVPLYIKSSFKNVNSSESYIVYTTSNMWNIIVTGQQNTNQRYSKNLPSTTYFICIVVCDYKNKGFNGKSVNECNKDEFEVECLKQLNIDSSEVLYFENFIDSLESKNGDLFVPRDEDYDLLVSVQTPYSNIFICGEFTELADPIFSLEGSCASANKAVEILQTNLPSYDN